MKRVITSARNPREYEVSIMMKYLRTRSSTDVIQNWVLESPNAQEAKDFAVDILAGMTPREIFEDFHLDLLDTYCTKYKIDPDELLMYDLAEKSFKFYVSKL